MGPKWHFREEYILKDLKWKFQEEYRLLGCATVSFGKNMPMQGKTTVPT